MLRVGTDRQTAGMSSHLCWGGDVVPGTFVELTKQWLLGV
jgi:hypothetical protein